MRRTFFVRKSLFKKAKCLTCTVLIEFFRSPISLLFYQIISSSKSSSFI